MKLLWLITGASHNLEETIESISKSNCAFDIALSKSGESVVQYQGLYEQVEELGEKIFLESQVGSIHFIITQLSRYDFIILSPATSNTVNKIAYGISDTLITNIVAQALKKKISVYILPTDQEEEIEITWNDKKQILYPRKSDLDNIEKLKKEEGVRILRDIRELNEIL